MALGIAIHCARAVPRAAFWHSAGCCHTDVGCGGAGLTLIILRSQPPDPLKKVVCIKQSSPCHYK